MSSGFISEKTGEVSQASKANNDDWVRAQQIIAASRAPKPASGTQEGGKSLYEVLEHNKAAKQEAFEESNRLKNQFRQLDEDEVDFLDSVLESTRAQEDLVKKETAESLEAFRKQREAAEKVVVGDNSLNEVKPSTQTGESWTTQLGRKRRRQQGGEAHSTGKLRRLSSSKTDGIKDGRPGGLPEARPSELKDGEKVQSEGSKMSTAKKTAPANSPSESPPKTATSKPPPTSNAVPSLGLGAYSSDDE